MERRNVWKCLDPQALHFGAHPLVTETFFAEDQEAEATLLSLSWLVFFCFVVKEKH